MFSFSMLNQLSFKFAVLSHAFGK